MDWIWGLVGGVMIGSAAAFFLLVNGRIMGASGIVGGVLDSVVRGDGRGARAERLAFLAGLVAVPAVLAALAGGAETYLTPNLGVVILAGLCVGLGTRLANGCTSGHGVCGISRLSWRGMAATGLYLLAGALTVGLLRTALGIL